MQQLISCVTNGENALMVCISKNGKRKYKSLGISIKPQFWDFTKNQPKRNCPYREEIQTLINENTKEYSEQILEYKLTQKEFTATKLIERVNKSTSSNTVQDFLNREIDRLKDENRLKSSIVYKEFRSSMLELNKAELVLLLGQIRVNNF